MDATIFVVLTVVRGLLVSTLRDIKPDRNINVIQVVIKVMVYQYIPRHCCFFYAAADTLPHKSLSIYQIAYVYKFSHFMVKWVLSRSRVESTATGDVFFIVFFLCVCDIIFVTADQSPTEREAEWGSLQTCNQNKEKKIMIIDKNKTTAQRKKNRFRYAISFYFLFPISLFQWISIPVGRSN